MNSDKNIGRLDGSVIFAMIIMIGISGAFLGYKYYNYSPCPDILFSMSDINPEVGEVVDFIDQSKNVTQRIWDFGDNTGVEVQGNPSHVYSEAGEYTVKLTINNSCFDYKTIVISNPLPVIDKTLIPDFIAPQKVKFGQRVNFRDRTEGATSWEWRFGETGKVDANTKNPSYTYNQPGRFTVTLVVDSDLKYLAKKTITVLPKEKERLETFRYKPKPKQDIYIPDSPEEYVNYEEPEAIVESISKPVASDEELVLLLTEFASGKKLVSELVPYFCTGNQSAMVKANGDLMRLSDLLAKIKGKDIRIKNLFTFREQDQCIQRFELKYSKKGVF